MKTLTLNYIKLFFTFSLFIFFFPSILLAESSNRPIVSITDITKTEGDSGRRNATLTVSIDTCPNKKNIKLSYITVDGTATIANADYVLKTGNIAFQKGNGCDKSKNITVKINGDTNVEQNENLTLELSDNGTNSDQSFTFSNDSGLITILGDDTADLSITKTVDDTAPEVGDTITYTIIGKNNGPKTTKITIEDILPNQLTWVSDSDNGKGSFNCTNSGQTVTCTGRNNIEKDETVTIDIEAEVVSGGTITNTATIESTQSIEDPISNNNEASVDVTVISDNADLYLLENLAPSPAIVYVNEDVTFSSRVKTNGPNNSQGPIAIKYSYNRDVTISSVTQTEGGGDFTCSPSSSALVSGSFITCTKSNALNTGASDKDFEMLVKTSIAGTLTQTAIITTTTPDLDTSNNTLISTIAIVDNTIENADDLCYASSTSCSGSSFGIGSCTSIPIKNIKNEDLSNTKVFVDTSGFGQFMSNCSIDGGANGVNCSNESDYQFGPVSMFAKGTEYNFANSITQANPNHTVEEGAFFDMTSISGYYATYTKNGQNYRGQLSQCSSSISIPDPQFEECGIFPSALNTWDQILSSNGDQVIYADEIFANNGVLNAVECIDHVPANASDRGADCNVGILTMSPPTLPTFIASSVTTNHTATANQTDGEYGDVTVSASSSVSFSPSITYSDSTTGVMLIKSLNIGTDATVTFGAGDYYIGSWTSEASLKVRTTGAVRLFINNNMDLTQNHVDFNYNSGTGEASDMFIFIYGNFIFASNGGGDIQNMTAYVYAQGTFTANHNTANSVFTGAVTSVGNISLNNNEQYNYDSSGLSGSGFGSCATSYCSAHGYAEGFHIVDPDGGDDSNSYEIYCDIDSADAPRDLIALPLKNDYNNFVFQNDLPSSNYYDSADSAKSDDANNEFSYLEVSISSGDYSITVVPTSVAKDSTNNEGYFSNINLIGTPFAIDWSNTTLSNCDTAKLRKGSWNQTVKINTLDYTQGRCRVESMKLKLLDDYKYLTFDDVNGGDEVLAETCRLMFEAVPENDLATNTSSNGHYWVDPDTGGRVAADTVTTLFRPFVAYCSYQVDINQAWTYVMALDAKVTNSKNDIKTMDEVRANPNQYYDSCSQLGLLFYVPNTKDTFQRTREYLFDNKTEWINYTGTIREKYQMYNNNPSQEYYISGEGYNEIWPYGPFGLYFPVNGSQSGSNDWYGGNSTQQAYMSGRCMNSGSESGAIPCVDYSTSASKGYAAITDDDGSLGIAGWRTTLMDQVDAGLQGITDGNQFWIADVGAGEYLRNRVDNSECSVTSPGSNPSKCDRVYYEPNGNYTQNAWLNFISDSNGNVYHNDDNGAFYSYYDYMCGAWDNYHSVSRYNFTEGPFTVIEHDSSLVDGSATPSNLNITTKIVSEPTDFDVLLLDDNRTHIVADQNISAGLFLIKIEATDGNEYPTDIHYYGEIGQNETFASGRINSGIISLNSDSPNPLTNYKISSANKQLAFQFKYCHTDTNVWTDCWTQTGSGANISAACSAGCEANAVSCECQTAESDNFAVRPDHFSLNSSGSTVVKAESVTLLYAAYNYDNAYSYNYNETINPNIELNASIADVSKSCQTSTLTLSTPAQFTNGYVNASSTFVDVGTWHVDMHEVSGFEFALVDLDDTPDNDRYITPVDINLTILPHHFTITAIGDIDNEASFTYLSNDLDNMGLKFDFNATAYNSASVITPNYSASCYANNTNIGLTYSSANIPASLNKLYYKDTSSGVEGNVSATSGSVTNILPSTIFTSDHNGTAEVTLRVNFGRTKNSAINPFQVTFTDLNISDQSVTQTDSSSVINSTATMLYGRTHAPRQRISGIFGNDFIYYEAYCNGSACDKTLLPGANNSVITDDPRWFVNSAHTILSGSVGNITQKRAAGLVTSGTLVNATSKTTVPLTYNPTTKGYPYKTTMENNASSWLIYDKYSAGASKNEFEVEFVNNVKTWAGEHETNATTNTNSSSKTNRRTMW